MKDTVADGRKIVTEGSGHVAPGPAPSPNGIMPPVSPPAPTPFTPAAFMYVARSASAKSHTTTTRGDKEISDRKILVKDSCMDVEQPGNTPAKPCETKPPNGADFSNWVVIGLAKVMSASASEVKVGASKENPALTGDPVCLNIPTHAEAKGVMGIHESESKLLEGVGLLDAAADASKNPCKIIRTGDPVAVATGEVVDDFTDLWLPGRFDLEWKRSYASARAGEPGVFGRSGFAHNLDQWIEIDEAAARLRSENGRLIEFPLPEPHCDVVLRGRRLRVARSGKALEVTSFDGHLTREFTQSGGAGRYLLSGIRDLFGNRVELRYDGACLACVVDTAKRELQLAYDAKWRLVRVTVCVDGRAHQHVSYTYDDNDDLVAVTDALGRSDTFAYDAKHRLVAKCIRGRVTFRYDYDEESGRCTRSRADRDLHNVQLGYDPTDRSAVVSGNPAPRAYSFDARGELLSFATPDGALAWAQKVDGDGLVTEQKNAAGDAWQMEYDERGHLVRMVAPGGVTTTWEYEGDVLRRRIDPEGRATELVYDHRGALVETKGQAGFFIRYELDVHGRLVGMAGPNGVRCSLGWDERHNLVRYTDADGATWHFRVDPMGRVLEERDPINRMTLFEYDAIGRLVRHTMPDGTVLSYAYDELDNVVESKDSYGTVIRTAYSGTGSVARKMLADGATWDFVYDRLERLRELKNPMGELYEFVYDRAGRIVEEVTFDGQVIRYRHNRGNQLARVEFVDETWIEYEYDARRFLARETTPHGAIAYERNDDGDIIKAVVEDALGDITLERTWDEGGRLVAETVNGRTIKYEYDRAGWLASRTLPNGQVTRYHYGPRGSLIGIEHDGDKISFQRDLANREVRRYFHRNSLDCLRSYADNDEPLEDRAAVHVPGGEAKPVAHRRHQYGAHARPVRSWDARWGEASYSYSLTGFLETAHTRSLREAFQYDAVGSVIGASANGEPCAPWKMRAGNVLLESADARFEYDVRRRRRRKIDRATEAVTEYLWDVKGQLREVVLPTNVRLFFSYDALGRRVRKTIVAPPNAAAPLDGKRTRTIEYVWDGDELAMEIDSVLGERVFVQMPGTFVPVLERRGGETFAYVTDRLGVPREVVDSRGQLAWAGLLSAWGEVTAEAGEDPRAAPPFRLLGQYHDQETGLLYARFRYFDPRTARWLSPDPIGIGGGNNLMAFNGSPTTDVDPLGLFNKSQFEQWLNKYYDMRKKAADAMEARLAALGGKKKLHSMDVRSVSSRSGLMGRTGSSRDPATGKDAHAEVNLTQKERRAGMEDGPRGVAASINHCGNCTQHVFETGGVTASPHRSTGNANGPAFPASAPSTPDDPKRWDGPPVNRWDNEPSGSSTP